MGSVLMALPVHIITHPVLYPQTGAFSLRKSKGEKWVFVCGFIARDDGAKAAYLPARRLQDTLTHAIEASIKNSDRYRLLQTIWEALLQLPGSRLGQQKGKDINLLIAVGDEQGVNLSATGLSGLWGKSPHGLWLPMVPQGNPILSIRGIPQKPPGSLFVAQPPLQVLATAYTTKPVLPSKEELKKIQREFYS